MTGLLVVVPRPLSSPVRRLANVDDPSNADPIFNVRLDVAALRRAGRIIPDDARYWIYTTRGKQWGHDLVGAGLLFFLPAIPVDRPEHASWVLSYRAGRLLPPGLAPLRVWHLGRGIALVHVRRA